jgi:hypothetical protein
VDSEPDWWLDRRTEEVRSSLAYIVQFGIKRWAGIRVVFSVTLIMYFIRNFGLFTVPATGSVSAVCFS